MLVAGGAHCRAAVVMKGEAEEGGHSLDLLLPSLLLHSQVAGPPPAASHLLHHHLPAVLLLVAAGAQVGAQAVEAGVEDLA
jgi:hypothetical protein